MSACMQVEAEVVKEEVPGRSSIRARNSTSIPKLLLCNAAQYLETPSLLFFPIFYFPKASKTFLVHGKERSPSKIQVCKTWGKEKKEISLKSI